MLWYYLFSSPFVIVRVILEFILPSSTFLPFPAWVPDGVVLMFKPLMWVASVFNASTYLLAILTWFTTAIFTLLPPFIGFTLVSKAIAMWRGNHRYEMQDGLMHKRMGD